EHAPAILRAALEAAVVAVTDPVQAGRVCDRKRSEHHRVNEGEDGRSATDAERKRKDRGSSKHGRLPQLAQDVTELVEDVGHSNLFQDWTDDAMRTLPPLCTHAPMSPCTSTLE